MISSLGLGLGLRLRNHKILNPKLKITRFGSRFNEFTSFVGWPLTNLVASRNNLEKNPRITNNSNDKN